MNIRSTFGDLSRLKLVFHVLLPVTVTAIFAYVSPNDITALQWTLSLILLVIPWSSYLVWRRQQASGLPVFSIISFMYWIYFALAVFWGSRTVSGVDTPSEAHVRDEAVTAALALTVVGVVAVWLGMRARLSRYMIPKRLPTLAASHSRTYIRLLLVISGLLGLFEGVPYAAGEGLRQTLTILVTLVPMLAFVILFRDYVRGLTAPIDNLLIAGFLVLRFVVGVSSGWLGSFAAIVVICGAVYLLEKRRVPRFALLLVVAFTLFFQVGKRDFREAFWQHRAEASKIDRVKFWAETSLDKWGNAFTDPTGIELNEALNTSLSRVSLLTQTANVVEMTPSVVPYQYWGLYSYLAVTWIPRFIWPNKPSVNDSNRFYQVAYGLSTEDSLESVSIGVGVLTESYISFGWVGVICVMFLMGIFYDTYQSIFFSKASGPLLVGIGIALLPQMLSLESQMAAYLGGILQQVILTIVVFLPVIRLSESKRKTLVSSGGDYAPYLNPNIKLLPGRD